MRRHIRQTALYVPLLAAVLWSGLGLVEKTWPIAPPFVEYRIRCRDRALEVVTVCIGFFCAGSDHVVFRVPDANVNPPRPIGLTAVDRDGDTLAVRREEGRWVVKNGGRDFTITYDLTLTVEDRYTPEINDMLTLFEKDRCRIMGRNVFIVPECAVSRGVFLDVSICSGGAPRSAWRSIGDRIIVPRIEDLSLTIVVSGNYRFLRRSVSESEVKLAIAGDWSFSDREFFDLICRIVLHEISLFGSSPHESYLFVCDRNPVRTHGTFDSFGAHFARNMVLLLDRRIDRSDLFDTPMSIIAHEFFHNWNGEAIRPASDRMLWFTEGVTVYYSYRILLDIKVIVPLQYESRRAEIARRYRSNPYRFDVAIASAVNSDLSERDLVNLLYDGGFLTAEALDRRLAELSGGRVHLIDVLRDLYHEGIGVEGLDEEMLCGSIRRVSGHDLSAFIDELVHEPAPSVLDELSLQPPREIVPADAPHPVPAATLVPPVSP